jgi:hypothetical protein
MHPQGFPILPGGQLAGLFLVKVLRFLLADRQQKTQHFKKRVPQARKKKRMGKP